MSAKAYAAIDLGPDSGRIALAILDQKKIEIEEVHRFSLQAISLPSGPHWNIPGLWLQVLEGLRKCGKRASERNVALHSLGVSAGGGDFALVGKSGQLLGLPVAGHSPPNALLMPAALKKVGEKALYEATGIQPAPGNTLFQLLAQAQAEPGSLPQTAHLLLIADLLHFFLTGVAIHELTAAGGGQMLDPRGKTGRWATPLLKKLGIPLAMLGKIVAPGGKVGKLRPEVAADTGLPLIPVIAPGSPTASAAAAAPVDKKRNPSWACLVSGPAGQFGVELDKPLITEAGRLAGFSNQRGVEGTHRFLNTLPGAGALLREVRRDYARRGHEYDYGQLMELAGQTEPFRTLIEPGHPDLASGRDICNRIAAFAHASDQPTLHSPGGFVRCCCESLALSCRRSLNQLETLLKRRIDVLHIVGEGARFALLNQMIADALARPVIVGPIDAAAVGNALTQALGAGHLRDLNQLRQVVRHSFELTWCYPRHAAAFESQRPRFEALRDQ